MDPRTVIESLSKPQLRIAFEFYAMGLPMRLSVAKALGLTPDELDLYEAGLEIGDDEILRRIAEARKEPQLAREPGADG